MKIRFTEKKDLIKVMKIYERARKFMAETGNPNQWGHNNWPPQYLIEEDIERRKSYVCVDDDDEDKVYAVFFYNFGDGIDSTYFVIEDGAWSKDAPYGVVHRIATDGTKGAGAFCINWAYEQAGYLRIDTHDDNAVMQHVLGKLGFTRRGIIHIVEDNAPRVAFDKN